MTVRVLHLAGTSIIGGAELNLIRTMDHGRKLGIEPVGVLVPEFGDLGGENGPLVARVRKLNIPVGTIPYYGLRARNPLRFFETIAKLVYWVQRSKPDIIHSNLQPLAEYAYILKRITGIPVICDVRGIHEGAYEKDFIPGYRKWLPQLDLVVACSNAVKEDLERHMVATGNVAVIYDGIDFNSDSDQRRHAVRTALRVDDDVNLVAVIGRISKEKGIGDFIQAVPMVLRSLPNTVFLVVGADSRGGKTIALYQAMASSLGVSDKILFTGFRDDIEDVLRAIDVFVLSSWSEAFPNSVLEAMASGAIVVATQVGGVTEMITSHVDGFLVAPRDHEALAKAMMEAIEMPDSMRIQMQSAAQARARQFTIDRQCAQLRTEYLRIACAPCSN